MVPQPEPDMEDIMTNTRSLLRSVALATLGTALVAAAGTLPGGNPSAQAPDRGTMVFASGDPGRTAKPRHALADGDSGEGTALLHALADGDSGEGATLTRA